jgi:hypothetical protein
VLSWCVGSMFNAHLHTLASWTRSAACEGSCKGRAAISYLQYINSPRTTVLLGKRPAHAATAAPHVRMPATAWVAARSGARALTQHLCTHRFRSRFSPDQQRLSRFASSITAANAMTANGERPCSDTAGLPMAQQVVQWGVGMCMYPLKQLHTAYSSWGVLQHACGPCANSGGCQAAMQLLLHVACCKPCMRGTCSSCVSSPVANHHQQQLFRTCQQEVNCPPSSMLPHFDPWSPASLLISDSCPC